MLIPVAGADWAHAHPVAQIIHRERKWLDIPDRCVVAPPQIVASRWVGHAIDRSEHEAEIEADCHVIGIALQPMPDITIFAAEKLVHTGPLPRGGVRVNEPGLALRGIFRGAYDVLHLHVRSAMIAEYAEPGMRPDPYHAVDRGSPRRRSGDRATGARVDPRRRVGWRIRPELRRRYQSRHNRPVVRRPRRDARRPSGLACQGCRNGD